MAQYTPKLNLYQWEVTDEKLLTFQEYNNNADKLEAAMITEEDLPYTKLGDALKLISSIYLGNDKNFFAYLSDGTYVNMVTMEQNDIGKLGDYTIPKLWIAARDYVQLRAPKVELATELNPDESAKTTRELFHVGNFCNHVNVFSSGNQTLTKLTNNKLSIMTSIQSSFPSGSFVNNAYTVPRTGIYDICFIAKVTTPLTSPDTYLRFGISRNRSGTVTDIDLIDDMLSNSYATPFAGKSILYSLNAGDIITPYINPLNEDVTIGSGTKFVVYFKGDTPTA